MTDLCIVFESWQDSPVDEDDVMTWFVPGRVVFLESLASKAFDVLQVPLILAVVCVRDEAMSPFHVDMLKRLDAAFSTVRVLYSPWMDDLTPELSRAIGLDMERLLADGLSSRHMMELNLRLDTWRSLFGLDASHMKRLGVTNPNHVCAGVSEALATSSRDAATVTIQL